MNRPRRFLPHPVLSLFLLGLWLMLVHSIQFDSVLMGALLAWLIPYFTQIFWSHTVTLHRPGLALRFAFTVLGDITRANWILAKRIIGPTAKLQPAFVEMPLALRQDFTISLLASVICLTPGTVAADLSQDRKYLRVHMLHVDNLDSAILELKTRYEAPLKEIFECSAT